METKDARQDEPIEEQLPPQQASSEGVQGDRPETMKPDESRQVTGPDRPIVAGIGASAGGLQALQAFFEAMPEDIGVAFVVIVHLSPEHRSHLGEILAACTTMPIQQVRNSLPLEGDHIYIIPRTGGSRSATARSAPFPLRSRAASGRPSTPSSARWPSSTAMALP